MWKKQLINSLSYPINLTIRVLVSRLAHLFSIVFYRLPLRSQYSMCYDIYNPVSLTYKLNYYLVYYRRRYFFSFYYVIVWHVYVVLFLVWYTALLQVTVVVWNLCKRLLQATYRVFVYLIHRYRAEYYWTRRGYYAYTLWVFVKERWLFFTTETVVSFLFSSEVSVLCK